MRAEKREPGAVRSYRARLARRVGLLLLIIIGAFALYGAMACAIMGKQDRKLARDPQTGVVRGCEARTIEPSAATARGAEGEVGAHAAGTLTTDTPTSAVLLIHGFVGSPVDYADLGEQLAAAGFHVRLMRLPGHCTRPSDFARQREADMRAAVEREFNALRARYAEVNVIGFSMGGALGTLLAADQAVDRLVLCAPYYGVTYRWFYGLPPEWWANSLGWALPYVVKSELFTQLNRRENKDKMFSYKVVPMQGVRTLMAIGRDAARPDTLGAVRCPVLMVISEGDMASSPRAARRAYEQLGSPDKHAVWYTRSNHQLFWDWDAEAAKAEIVGFLKSPKA